MAELNTPPASEREALAGLTAALGRRFYSILRVDPARDTVLILQSRDYPQAVQTQMDWGTYLERYGGIVTPQGRERLQKRLSGPALLAAAANGEHSFSLEVPYLKGRRTNWLTIHAALDRQAGGELYADIFVRQSNDEHLLHSIIDMYVYNSCDYFVLLDIHNNSYMMINSNPLETARFSAVCDKYESALVEYARSFVVPEDQEAVIRKMSIDNVARQLEDKEVYSFTAGVEDPERGYTRKQLTYRYYDRAAGTVLLCRTDVTEVYLEERARQRELESARLRAETDPLTGLLNHGGISRRAGELLESSPLPAAMLVLDLDNFKQVNDTLGHLEGDRLLCKVAQTLQLQSGPDALQGRSGGDEFVVFLPGTAPSRAGDCARQICEAVSLLTLPENAPRSVSCSIGAAFAPEDGRDYQSLFRVADRRAYQAKRLGKNRYLLEG